MAYGFAWPAGQAAARSAKVPDPPFRWRITKGPWFDNSIATLRVDGRNVRLSWEKPTHGDGDNARPELKSVCTVDVAPPHG